MASYVKRHVRKSQAERRQEILDATLEIISEHGLEGVTVTRIARAVGVTPGALYRHFDSRAALVSEAHKVANQRAADWICSSREEDVLKRLEHLGSMHLDWSEQFFSTVCRPFFMELASNPDPEVTERLDPKTFKSFRHIVEMVEEGKLKGQIRQDVPPEDVAWALHMFAWTDDIAVMAGEDDSVIRGSLRRNLKRMLDSFRAEPEPEEEKGPEA
jgi:AcrR family transcriptional regulator